MDTILGAVRQQLVHEDERVAQRLQIQIDLWEKAKAVIAEDAPKPDEDF